MILTGQPYVSDYFIDTVIRNRIPVIDIPGTRELIRSERVRFIGEEEAASKINRSENNLLYTVSESAIEWISDNLSGTGIPGSLEVFKDKVKFRDLTSGLYPDLFYREVELRQLDDLEAERLPLPAVIKPAVGFFSLGVNAVSSMDEWPLAVRAIREEAEAHGELYPDRVLDTSRFIIEEYIEGEEYAIDIYADGEGRPVVVGILKHLFGSEDDVSDRVYVTSAEIIEDRLELFTEFGERITELAGLKNFPFHAEVRIGPDGRPVPIEINPLRFGAWCTTADLTGKAFGINPYEYYFFRKRPDWNELLSHDRGKLYSLVALNNTTGLKGDRIESFDYDKLASMFENPLEVRKWDFRENPLFGFLVTETSRENISELEYILRSDLSEFVVPADPGR
ncbi:MAG: ATP-grasp domain-containing protein [Candidatus Krumholzibacteriales bacterium]